MTTVFVAFIAFAFIFTFDGPRNLVGAGDVAKVGSHVIDVAAFNREYNQQLRMLSYGGKSPTAEQIKVNRIRHRALKMAIEKKLYLVLAENLAIRPGPATIRKTIRERADFQTDGQFDLVKYKNLLRVNRLTPASYEGIIAEELMIGQSRALMAMAVVAKNFAREVVGIKKIKKKVSAVEIKNIELEKLVKISPGEITDFLATEQGKRQVEELFAQKKSLLSRAEEIRARHILFKGKDGLARAQKVYRQASAKNFSALAKKHSADTSNQKKGGDLGWFARGRMVKEFDQVAFALKAGEVSPPVKTSFGHHLILREGHRPAVVAKLADHERKLTQQLIRRSKTGEVSKLRQRVAQEFQQKLGKKNWQRLAKKYNLRPQLDQTVGLLDSWIGSIELSGENQRKLFSSAKKDVFIKESATSSVVLHRLGEDFESGNKKQQPAQQQAALEAEREQQRRQITFQMNREWMGRLWRETPIKCQGRSLEKEGDVFKCQI